MEALATVQTSMVQMPSVFDPSFFQRFVGYIDREPTTVKGYITCLRRFAAWLLNNLIQQPQRADILAYKEYLNGENFGRSGKEALKPSTKQQYLRAVKQFFKWTASEGLYPNIADNVHSIKVRNDIHRKDALEREAVKEIADKIDRSTETGKRLYAMYLLCVSCGLRTIEIHRANIGDIKTVGGRTYLYVQGKGHTEHDQPVLLVPEVKAAIQDYMSSRSDHHTKKSPLFASTSNRSFGQRIASTTISTMLKKALVSAGYDSDRLTAHSLRHTSGTGAYKATGGNIYLAQKHQRHADVSTTEIYVHAEERESRNTEQQVFDYYFRPAAAQDPRQETINMIAALNPEKLLQVCEIIKAFC